MTPKPSDGDGPPDGSGSSGDDPASRTDSPTPFESVTEAELREAFDRESYVANDALVTTVRLALRLGKPLLVEGEPGSGKTELAKALASGFGTELIRLQCYEGLVAEHALYEWNYTKQLLAMQAADPAGTDAVFGREFLLERPLLRALTWDGPRPPVLLIDEVDRADEEFEALLLEVLSEYQLTIPEFGTVAASRPPVVVITSNRTRALGDALKRRCLYLHVSWPTPETEREIVCRKFPALREDLVVDLCAVVAALRAESLLKPPGVSETLDFAAAVAVFRERTADGPLERCEIKRALGCLLKETPDVERVDDDLLDALLDAAAAARRDGA
ncbi:AAA family ATPase [Haloferacaceae archaeon DSL9]